MGHFISVIPTLCKSHALDLSVLHTTHTYTPTIQHTPLLQSITTYNSYILTQVTLFHTFARHHTALDTPTTPLHSSSSLKIIIIIPIHWLVKKFFSKEKKKNVLYWQKSSYVQ